MSATPENRTEDEKQTFLARCSDAERPAFEVVIEALESLVKERSAEDAASADRPQLRWVLEKVSMMLQLRLPKRADRDAADVPLLYIWPSTEQARKELPDSLSVSVKQLAKLPPAVVERYGRDLEQAGFVRKTTEGWRTSTFQQVEKGRLTRIFVEGKWGPVNVINIVTAVRNLVEAVA
jgi:hypothetical protein